MASAKSFYGKRTQHHFLFDAVQQIQDDDPKSVDIVKIGPLTGGQDNDLENEDDTFLNTTKLLEEIPKEIKAFSIRNDEIDRMTSDGDNSDVGPPPAKKQKQNPKNP